MNNILITTGDIHEEYEIIDAVFALDSCQQTFFKGADPNTAFEKVKNALRQKASDLGGHAVINCQFEYRIAVNQGLGGGRQVVEIFAYGTAVRLH